MQRAPALARLVKTDHCSWYADAEGVLLCRGGPAVDRVTATGYVPPATVHELYQGRPDLLRLYSDALRGRPQPATVAEWGGFLWELEMQAVGHGDAVAGVLCTCFILEPEPGVPAPEASHGAAVYEAAGDDGRHGVWSGDRFWDYSDEDVILQIRLRARSEFDRYRRSDPTRVHLLRASASRPLLRLI
jgi:hypothetical protein